MKTIAFEVDETVAQNLTVWAKLRGYVLPDGSTDFAQVFGPASRDIATHVRLEVGILLAAYPAASAQVLAAVETHLEAVKAAKTAATVSQEPAPTESTAANTTTEETPA